MALATRCPACETIFRISTTQAAAKSGMVRCGQCRNTFNSLDALVRVEDLDVLEEQETPADPSAPIATGNDVRVDDHFDRVDADRHGVDAGEIALLAPSQHIDEEFEGSDDPAQVAQTPAPGPVEGAVFSEWWLPQSGPATPAPALAPTAAPESETELPAKAVENFKARSLQDRRVSVEWDRSSKVLEEPVFMRAGAPRNERSRAERWTLVSLSVVAALGLVAQAAYVWRNELSVRAPAIKPWLVAACASLRCVVDYPAHIDAITIESTALQSSGPNSSLYTLTALVRNRDAVAIRYPYLELTLTDTQDRPILRRALRPEDYLAPSRDAGARPQASFAAESELPLRMMFELNDLRFVGYRLEQFYP